MKPETIALLCTAALVAIPAYAAEIDASAIIATHNKWRAKAGVPEKLTYSPALAATAQAWADNLKRASHCRMRHSKPDGQYGENLYWASALTWSNGHRELQNVSPERVVDSWGSEEANYDYAKNRCTPGKMCGHYTQVVWRSTTTVGCAMAVCDETLEQVWVCQYQPAGNLVGSKPY
ncbi:MAG: CAP domain-containing protein [Sulfuricaulis sp.]|nr:CAP domain-containing protein [Sulfuricaulis sp.]